MIPRNRSRIGIHGVEEELHLGLPAALQVAGEVIWDDDSSLHGSVLDGVAHLLRVEIGARQTKTSALVELCDQLTALRRTRLIENTQAQVLDFGVESKAKEKDLQNGRNDQNHHAFRVSAKLIKLFLNKSEKALKV